MKAQDINVGDKLNGGTVCGVLPPNVPLFSGVSCGRYASPSEYEEWLSKNEDKRLDIINSLTSLTERSGKHLIVDGSTEVKLPKWSPPIIDQIHNGLIDEKKLRSMVAKSNNWPTSPKTRYLIDADKGYYTLTSADGIKTKPKRKPKQLKASEMSKETQNLYTITFNGENLTVMQSSQPGVAPFCASMNYSKMMHFKSADDTPKISMMSLSGNILSIDGKNYTVNTPEKIIVGKYGAELYFNTDNEGIHLSCVI